MSRIGLKNLVSMGRALRPTLFKSIPNLKIFVNPFFAIFCIIFSLTKRRQNDTIRLIKY